VVVVLVMSILPSITFTRVVLGLFIAYVVNVCFVIHNLFKPPECVGNNRKCLPPAYKYPQLSKLKLSIYISRSSSASRTDAMDLAWDSGDSSILEKQDTRVNLTIPFQTRRNGSLYAFVFVHPRESSPFDKVGELSTFQMYELSRYAVPKDKEFNLIQGSKENSSAQPITHIFPRISVYVATQDARFDRYSIPSDVYHLLKLNNQGAYLPLLYVDGLSSLQRHLVPVYKDTDKMPVQVYFTPVSLGRLRIWSSVEQTLGNMKNLGFTENDLDDMKGIFSDTNLYFLAMTFTIALVHMLFDVLAFKNDISFWQHKDSMEGMSMRTVLWRFISSSIVFLYLLDEKTSLLVLVPSGIGALIELWKVTKALKIKISWQGSWLPSITYGERTDSEKVTEEFDVQAMRYLSYVLYPLLVGVSVYSLVYQPHKSWYSWIVRSLVNGVYAFGFLFMLPQLFVNYKLKSVAHLPWRAFTYKAFNTFIDDVFAFIIVMPTAHRVACFRDDAVFLVYLYQRWLYPVDKTRANEFGMVFEEKKDNDGQDVSSQSEESNTSLGDEGESKKDK